MNISHEMQAIVEACSNKTSQGTWIGVVLRLKKCQIKGNRHRKHRVDRGGLFGHEFISELVFIQIDGRRQNKERYSQLTAPLHCP